MKTYIVDWYSKTKNGAYRNYRKIVQTDNIESYIRDKMKLVVGCIAFGHYKGTFSNATEVCKSGKFGYDYQTVEGGEYWCAKNNKIECCICKWHNFYDYKLKCWNVS